MRRVTIDPNNPKSALLEIQRASGENDTIDMAQNFTLSGTLTQTTTLNLSSPTVANVAAVLGTLLNMMQKGGTKRTG